MKTKTKIKITMK